MGAERTSLLRRQPEHHLHMGHLRPTLNKPGQREYCVRHLRGCAHDYLPSWPVDFRPIWQRSGDYSCQALHLPETPGDWSRPKAGEGYRGNSMFRQDQLSTQPSLHGASHQTQVRNCLCCCVGPARHVEGCVQRILASIPGVDPSHQDRHSDCESGRKNNGYACHNGFEACFLNHNRAGRERQPSHPAQPERKARRDDPIPPVHRAMIARCAAYSQASEARV